MASKPRRRARRSPARKNPPASARPAHRAARPRFVGRDPSPVLDRYPPKIPDAPRTPVAPAPPRTRETAPLARPVPASAAATQQGASAGGAPTEGLIRLEKPFDVDEFSQMLGETAIRLTVPRDALTEVLRRTTDFMGFGIYVYSITVRPSSSELLKGFVVELQRVDYDPETKTWKPFVEKGAGGAPGNAAGSDAA